MVSKEEYAELLQMILELQDKVDENNTILKSIVDQLLDEPRIREIEISEAIEEAHEQELAGEEEYVRFRKHTEKAAMYERGDGMITWVPKSKMTWEFKPDVDVPISAIPKWCQWKEDTYGG